VGVNVSGISVSSKDIMTTKSLKLYLLVWSPFGLVVMCWLKPTIVVSICLFMFSGCAALFRPTIPVLHEPFPCDLRPVLKLQFPKQIDTLAGIPRTEIIVENGINKLVGGRQPDEIKEWFYFKEADTEYIFMVFYSEAAAIKEYRRDSCRHVFQETMENGLTGRVHYTEEPRADPEAGSGPMGYYLSRADFRLKNLYVRVVTRDRDAPQNAKLSNAVKDLGQMLSGALGAKP
jgi:hypothetical protein